MCELQSIRDAKDAELISMYSNIVTELHRREIIRTRNIVGDLGERFVVDLYTRSPTLENLSLATPGAECIDAIGESGNRYAIKSITSNLTGVFYGLPQKDSDESPNRLFDYLVVVLFSKSYQVKAVYEFTWEKFIAHKRWHSRMKAWNILLNKTVVKDAEPRYLEGDDVT